MMMIPVFSMSSHDGHTTHLENLQKTSGCEKRFPLPYENEMRRGSTLQKGEEGEGGHCNGQSLVILIPYYISNN